MRSRPCQYLGEEKTAESMAALLKQQEGWGRMGCGMGGEKNEY